MEQRGFLGEIAVMIFIGILIAIGGMLGGPNAWFGHELSVPSASAEFYAYDAAKALDTETENYIIGMNTSLQDQCGAQVVVACVRTIGDDADIDEYASTLFDKWGIGAAGENNGVLVLLATEDENYYMLQGKGITTSLSNSKIESMLKQKLEPDFARGDYDAGVTALFDGIIEYYEDSYGIEVAETDTVAVNGSAKGGGGDCNEEAAVGRGDIAKLPGAGLAAVMGVVKIVIIAVLCIALIVVLIAIIVIGKKKPEEENVSQDGVPAEKKVSTKRDAHNIFGGQIPPGLQERNSDKTEEVQDEK